MKTESKSCWNCGKTNNDFFFCCHCNKIQKPIETDSFKLFSLPYIFDLNTEKLETNFFVLRHKLHPDKFLNASKNEKLFSGIHSANLNESFNTLVDPISRAGALLKIHIDYDLKEKTINDKTILFEIMELEEEKDNIKKKEDTFVFLNKIIGLIEDNIKKINDNFLGENYFEAARIHTKLIYLNKIKKDFKKAETDL